MFRLICAGFLVLVLLSFAVPVAAQEPTPQPSPTPAVDYPVTLTSGNVIRIERSFTYGDIATTLAVLSLLAWEIIKSSAGVFRKWGPVK